MCNSSEISQNDNVNDTGLRYEAPRVEILSNNILDMLTSRPDDNTPLQWAW